MFILFYRDRFFKVNKLSGNIVSTKIRSFNNCSLHYIYGMFAELQTILMSKMHFLLQM